MDGVLVDFHLQFKHYFKDELLKAGYDLSYVSSHNYENDPQFKRFSHRMIKTVGPEFWFTMPFTKFGRKLWKSIKKKDVTILTGIDNSEEHIKLGKSIWIQNNLKVSSDIMICDINKSKYCKGRNNILIDDSVINCMSWEKAGGAYRLYVDVPLIANSIIEDVSLDLIC